MIIIIVTADPYWLGTCCSYTQAMNSIPKTWQKNLNDLNILLIAVASQHNNGQLSIKANGVGSSSVVCINGIITAKGLKRASLARKYLCVPATSALSQTF